MRMTKETPITMSFRPIPVRTFLLGVALMGLPALAPSAMAEQTRITVVTGTPAVPQSHIAGARSEQTIRIVVADPVRPGIRRPPVAEPVLYVIESDADIRAVR